MSRSSNSGEVVPLDSKSDNRSRRGPREVFKSHRDYQFVLLGLIHDVVLQAPPALPIHISRGGIGALVIIFAFNHSETIEKTHPARAMPDAFQRKGNGQPMCDAKLNLLPGPPCKGALHRSARAPPSPTAPEIIFSGNGIDIVLVSGQSPPQFLRKPGVVGGCSPWETSGCPGTTSPIGAPVIYRLCRGRKNR